MEMSLYKIGSELYAFDVIGNHLCGIHLTENIHNAFVWKLNLFCNNQFEAFLFWLVVYSQYLDKSLGDISKQDIVQLDCIDMRGINIIHINGIDDILCYSIWRKLIDDPGHDSI